MTQDELARMPEGGYSWKWTEDQRWCSVYEGMGLVCRVNERNARQIVGSVNAAIIIRKMKEDGESEYCQIKEAQFWLDYAKGDK